LGLREVNSFNGERRTGGFRLLNRSRHELALTTGDENQPNLEYLQPKRRVGGPGLQDRPPILERRVLAIKIPSSREPFSEKETKGTKKGMLGRGMANWTMENRRVGLMGWSAS
jgi:hypothetical protein